MDSVNVGQKDDYLISNKVGFGAKKITEIMKVIL